MNMFKLLYLNSDVSGKNSVRSRAQETTSTPDKEKCQMYPLRALHFLQKGFHFCKVTAQLSGCGSFPVSLAERRLPNSTPYCCCSSAFYQFLIFHQRLHGSWPMSQTVADWPGHFTTKILSGKPQSMGLHVKNVEFKAQARPFNYTHKAINAPYFLRYICSERFRHLQFYQPFYANVFSD